MKYPGPVAIALTYTVCAAAIVYSQARSAPDWTTERFDAQRTSWMRVDPYISPENLEKFQFLWKLKLDNESRFGNSLTAPVALGNLMTFRGFKSLIFVGGSSNNVYAIDYDFGTLFWRTHHNYAAGPREYAGSPTCPGGMTAPLTRATTLTPPAQLSFFGFARPPRPAKGDVGEPGKGAPQLAEIAARLAARGRGAGPPETPARGAPPPARGDAGREGRAARGPNYVFSVAADGLVRAMIPDTGDPAAAPALLLPANATATGLIWTDGYVYAATTNTCGGAPIALFAMDYQAEKRVVSSWPSEGASIAGFSLDADGTVFVATRNGTSRYANSVVALDGRTLALKDWFTTNGDPFIATPVVFSEGDRSYVAAVTETSLYVLDARSLGGANHTTPTVVTPPSASTRFADGVATWRDASGVRWLLAPVSGAIGAYRFNTNGPPALARAWTSRNVVSPRTPIIVNGVVFALAGGRQPDVNAALYALDAATGKDTWTSGNVLTSVASAGLSAGTGQVYVVTSDNTVWAFGIPLAIN